MRSRGWVEVEGSVDQKRIDVWLCCAWLAKEQSASLGAVCVRAAAGREEAVKTGRELVRRSFIHHVTHEHDFEDDFLFYRFLGEDSRRSLNAKLTHKCSQRPGKRPLRSTHTRMHDCVFSLLVSSYRDCHRDAEEDLAALRRAPLSRWTGTQHVYSVCVT